MNLVAWNPEGLKRLAGAAIQLVVYGVPAILLAKYLTKLSGGTLWVPPEWHNTVLTLGFLGGLAVFQLARLDVARRWPPAREPNEGRARAARRQRLHDEEQRASVQFFALGRALGWLVLTVLAVCGHTILRMCTVYTWAPDVDQVERLKEEVAIEPPMYLEGGAGPPYHGSFLLPLGFPTSTEGELLLEDVKTCGRGSRHAYAIDHCLLDLVDVVRFDERLAYSLTLVALLVAHLAILALASASFGYSFSWAEEIAGLLA